MKTKDKEPQGLGIPLGPPALLLPDGHTWVPRPGLSWHLTGLLVQIGNPAFRTDETDQIRMPSLSPSVHGCIVAKTYVTCDASGPWSIRRPRTSVWCRNPLERATGCSTWELGSCLLVWARGVSFIHISQEAPLGEKRKNISDQRPEYITCPQRALGLGPKFSWRSWGVPHTHRK